VSTCFDILVGDVEGGGGGECGSKGKQQAKSEPIDPFH
jgi:hypothetical protein